MAVRVRRGHAVGSTSRTRAMALSVLALLTVSSFGTASAAASSTPIATGTSCEDETVRWGGFQVLDAAIPSFDTGVDVVPRAGTTMTVIGVSADGLDPSDRAHSLPVLVGGTRALPGVAVEGGDVIVSTDGTEVLRVAGVTVVVRRCADVAVAVAGPGSVASSTDASTSGSSEATGDATASWPSAEEAVAVVSTLPVTGRESWVNTIIGGLLVALGAALVTVGRRPRPDGA